MSQNQQPPSSQNAFGAEPPMQGSAGQGQPGSGNAMSGQQNQQAGQQGQQGSGGSNPGQQQQFDSSGGGQQGGGGQFAGQIQPHMSVSGSDGQTCGTVDHLDGDRIKLTKDDNGEHKYVPLSLVEKVENNEVTLRSRGDQAFGMNAE